MPPPIISMPPAEAISNAMVLNSRERATCPLSRDSRSRFGVGCSVRSCPVSAAMSYTTLFTRANACNISLPR